MKTQNKSKTYLFQYVCKIGWSGDKIIEDTNLITEEEASNLWDKYYSDFIKRLKRNEEPKMCIWKDCSSEIDYHTVYKEIDYRDDLDVKDGVIYKKEPLN